MYLFLFLLAFFPLSVVPSILHITQDTTIPKERLGGFKYIKAAAFVTSMQQASADKTSTMKYAYLCRYAYCHDVSATVKCNEVCHTLAEKYDRPIVTARVKKLNGSKVPAADHEACRKECRSDCGNKDCKRECDYLCAMHFDNNNRKKYEDEFNELIGRFNGVGSPPGSPVKG